MMNNNTVQVEAELAKINKRIDLNCGVILSSF